MPERQEGVQARIEQLCCWLWWAVAWKGPIFVSTPVSVLCFLASSSSAETQSAEAAMFLAVPYHRKGILCSKCREQSDKGWALDHSSYACHTYTGEGARHKSAIITGASKCFAKALNQVCQQLSWATFFTFSQALLFALRAARSQLALAFTFQTDLPTPHIGIC